MTIALDVANVGTKNVGAVSSTTLTTGATVASNGLIVLACSVGVFNAPTAVISTVTGGGLTWTGHSGLTSLSRERAEIWSAPAPSGLASSTVLTITFSLGIDYASLAASSYTGTWNTPAVEATQTNDNGTGTAWSSGNLVSAAGGLIATAAGLWAVGTSTPTSPTVEDQDFGPALISVTLGRRIEAAGGTYTNAGTWSLSDQVATASAAFKESVVSAQNFILPQAARVRYSG